jgi:hypothetical protein
MNLNIVPIDFVAQWQPVLLFYCFYFYIYFYIFIIFIIYSILFSEAARQHNQIYMA